MACQKTYRMIVVKKYLEVSQGQSVLFHDYRYFFYLTNDWELSAAEVVFEANDRCDQENLNCPTQGRRAGLARAGRQPGEQLGLHGDDLAGLEPESLVGLALARRAWATCRARREEKRRVLRMEFKTFLNAFVRLPCQIVQTGRRLIYRLLGWNPWQGVLFRWLDQLRC